MRRMKTEKAPEVPAAGQPTFPTRKAEAEDTSAKLAEALKKGDQEHRMEGSRAVVFESANAPKAVEMSQGMQRIVESTFFNSEEVHAGYKRLKEGLTLGERRTEPGYVVRALDMAPANFFDAQRLYVTARLEFENWERHNAVSHAVCRTEATRFLQKEKADGVRSKQITDADIESQCALMFPEEWMHTENERSKNKHMVDTMKVLVEAWGYKCQTLKKH